MKDADRRGSPLEPQEPVRLQKALAEAGLGSRREIEGWIREGRVRVNGALAQLGDRVQPSDRIRVDGQEVRRRAAKRHSVRVLAYHKPEGEVVTRKDPEGRPTIFRRLPGIRDGRWIAVGRLDLNTAGLLLVTNHGELANRLMHPSRAVEREYAVRVRGSVSDQLLAQLVNGVELEDGPARFEEIVPSGGSESHQWFHVLIVEGRNREVRRLWEAVGCTVSRLKRVRYGNVILGARPTPGQWREVVGEELEALMALAELGPPVAARTGLSPGSSDKVPDKGPRPRGSAKPRAVASPQLAGRGLKPRPSGRR
ncbi:23S rRNA pseudouridylate synthase B [Lamprobacter modestohalophilus]|uniref:Pseudouridine synthase n=1 Tax=Lamprobacter modestohalophilus TaxID=1064514 RepID=A0A9X0WAS8_9GAMM|nr:pseudouridine synthase [Lamprobacter modestohalophilus]MBK1620123.1 23S rRNA pseudouridylate synthase B [Lamprobacter modestohalophilus]